MTDVLCEHCAAACCRYLALPIDKPTAKRDYDDMRWYLMHEGISVFVEDGDWYIQIRTRCKNLGADNRCRVYLTRPQICEAYKPGDCDYSVCDSGYDHFFTHPEQIEDHYSNKTGKALATDRSSSSTGRSPNRHSQRIQNVPMEASNSKRKRRSGAIQRATTTHT